ncbi:MAG: membrane protein insertase YidC [Gemmatimonadota bacterium]
MQKRLILAVVLTIAVIVVTNIVFPPGQPPRQATGGDTAADTARPASTDTGARRAGRAGADTSPAGEFPTGRETRELTPGDTVVVSSPLYEYRFTTRGAAMVGARLMQYASYAESDSAGERVQLIREGDRLLGYRIAVGGDTLSLADSIFEASAERLELSAGSGPDTLRFSYPIPNTRLTFDVRYVFEPDSYVFHVTGNLRNFPDRGWSVLTSLGQGLRTNEANAEDDYNNLSYVVNSRSEGISDHSLVDVEAGTTRAAENAPFRWVAVKNKYFVVSLVDGPDDTGFGGLLARGLEADHAAQLTAAMPVPAGRTAFDFRVFAGPQEFDRLSRVGQELAGVNPYGWSWVQPVMRPLVSVITEVLTWMHSNLNLAYGYVLILFGIMVRAVLFPLYQKSMRAQMAQMEVQPKMKKLQDKYEDDPEKLQQEMMKLYREHDINPLAGCLPMLLPFPILITLFFVFKNTIEFRGVPFWWLSDLSQADPYYIIPVIMGASMFLMQYIGQRGMDRNTMMKAMTYGMPVVMTIVFLNFPAGLNLYYATSNLASLPQQFYLSRERMKRKKKGG